MIKNNIVLIALLLSFLSTNHSLANDDSTLGVLLKSRHDIDYHLNTYAVSVSLITPAGLFRCDPGALAGKTRIDSFNNIVGISDVRNAEWNSFYAHDLECRYGAKWNAVEGTFKAGIGFRDYQGNTDDKPGGKDISIEGAGALLDYESEVFDAKLEWEREIHDYTLMHQTSVGNYDSLIDATKNTFNLSSTYGKLYIHAKHLRGNKDNVYTTPLFPTNRFRYGYTDLAIGMNLMPEADGLTLFAPIIGNGSYRGSFNPLSGNSGLKGLQLAGRAKGFELDFYIVRHEGEGSRPYLPATEQLTENKDATTIAIGIKRNAWTARLEHSKSIHTANAAIAHPTYAAIVGGYGPFNNKRAEEKWTLSASFPLLKKVTADLSLYHTARHDRQFTHPEHNYTEKGGFILLIFRK
ncbi:hypothetical protein [Candidatus Thiodiazotropha sp. CDECU1]|uniref:hypothetical protein n=1 Tax=Candidatus Thiodiazotropha sp. CDECU1 TaxID=3065865 RepID=UPI00292F1B18|nr:hypothetical protein [Candidatus Thiodiazotropha sp. CDECU1]